MRKIQLTEKAYKYLKTHRVEDITIDIENFGDCCIGVPEAIVSCGVPDKQSDYDYYRVDGIGVFVYKPIEFIGNRVKVTISKLFLVKPRLIAGDIKLLY